MLPVLQDLGLEDKPMRPILSHCQIQSWGWKRLMLVPRLCGQASDVDYSQDFSRYSWLPKQQPAYILT